MGKILVTGGAGFIGSHITQLFAKDDIFEVIVIDNLISGDFSNIRGMDTTFYNIDIRNRKELDNLFRDNKITHIIHQAAQVSVSASIKDPLFDAEENVIGLINLLDMAVKYKVKRFIFASSAAVYGMPQSNPVKEEHPLDPISFYGFTKMAGEKYIKMYNRFFGLDYIIFRYSNVYGERQSSNGEAGVVAIFMDKMKKKEKITIDGDGKQTRDFVYVKDVAMANYLAIKKEIKNETINLSTNYKLSIYELFNIMSREMRYGLSPVYGAPREGDIKDSCLSNLKLKKLLDWTPKYTIEEGIMSFVEHEFNR